MDWRGSRRALDVVRCMSNGLIQLDMGPASRTFDEPRNILADKRYALTVRVCTDRANLII